MGIILWIILGGIAGWVASIVMGRDAKQGMLGNVILGIIGAFVGGFLDRELFGGSETSLSEFDLRSLIVATLGAIVVLFIYRLLTGKK